MKYGKIITLGGFAALILAAGCKQEQAQAPAPDRLEEILSRPRDHDVFKDLTVHFDFDRSVVKRSEEAKIASVAAQFRSADRAADLLIEGHCDERGTPEYNRALGKRRAAAIREYLVQLGINPARIHTISFGKDRPMALGHDEVTWSQNRRGEFVLILPL
jgi:peptidoglycan-associated lipoprotein